jgi:hypothetical protein
VQYVFRSGEELTKLAGIRSILNGLALLNDVLGEDLVAV